MSTTTYPKISIITPSYNQGQFIRETIDSVLSQGYPNLEYWVIDGGSRDNTVEILKSYGAKIKWVSAKDQGQTDAINKGLKKVSGEIIAYLNSDDVYLPNTFFTVAEYFMSHHQAEWLTGDYFIIDDKGNKIQSWVAWYKKILRQSPSFNVLCVANFIIQPSTFWRKSLVKKVGVFNPKLRYCMDFEYWLRAMNQTKLHVIDHHLSLFRIHHQSKGGAQYRQQFREEHQIVIAHSSNILVRFLHKLHAEAIILAYQLIKK